MVWALARVAEIPRAARRRNMELRLQQRVIGYLKAEHHMGRNYLKGPKGDRFNAVLATAGYNFSLLLRWMAEISHALILMLARITPSAQPA